MEKEHSSHHRHRHHHRHHTDDSEVFKNKNLQSRKRRKLFAKILFWVMSIAAFAITLFAIVIYLLD